MFKNSALGPSRAIGHSRAKGSEYGHLDVKERPGHFGALDGDSSGANDVASEGTHPASKPSTLTTTPSTLLEELVERTRLSWPQVTVAVGLVLILFLVGAAYLDGVLVGPFNADFWRTGLLYPAIIAYTLLIQPILRRLRDGAIEAFRPLVPIDDEDFHRLLAEEFLFNRRREWVALGIGAAGGVLLTRPWAYYGPFWPADGCERDRVAS